MEHGSVQLDYGALQAPTRHGEVLVAPEPRAWLDGARGNHEALGTSDRPLLDSTLAHWRKATRERLVGTDERLVFVFGHQPSFFHPGVWAKNVAGMRAALACGGVALNLVVDNDAPRQAALAVPVVREQRLVLRHIVYASGRSGVAYEEFPGLSGEELERFRDEVRGAMGGRYGGSQMPRFFDGALSADRESVWTDQMVAGRRAVEAAFDVRVSDVRVSRICWAPMVADLVWNARRFAAAYNTALARYRREQNVRGSQQPIPDLTVEADRYELPVWVYRRGEARRRLFVSGGGDVVALFAGHERIGEVPKGLLRAAGEVETWGETFHAWRVRPRALALTLWARLLLADLFVHGIGGAKYDRISDAIMRDYYGVTPPAIGCVSATLHPDLPAHDVTAGQVGAIRRAIRDLQYNPQRQVRPGSGAEELVARRAEAVERGERLKRDEPGNRRARGEVFRLIRRLNDQIREAVPGLAGKPRELTEELIRTEELLRQNRIARGREYFFGLYDRERLERLLSALPAPTDFGV